MVAPRSIQHLGRKLKRFDRRFGIMKKVKKYGPGIATATAAAASIGAAAYLGNRNASSDTVAQRPTGSYVGGKQFHSEALQAKYDATASKSLASLEEHRNISPALAAKLSSVRNRYQ